MSLLKQGYSALRGSVSSPFSDVPSDEKFSSLSKERSSVLEGMVLENTLTRLGANVDGIFAPVETVDVLDMDRYTGRWFQVRASVFLLVRVRNETRLFL